MKLKLIAAVVLVIVLAGAYFVFFNNSSNPNPTPTPNASVSASTSINPTPTPSVAAALLDCSKIVSETDLKQVFGSTYSFSVEKQAQVNQQCVLYQVDPTLNGVNDNKLWFGNVNVKQLSEFEKFLNAKNTAINVSQTNEVGLKSLKISYLSETPYAQTELMFAENTGSSVIDVYLLKLNVANKTIGAQITYEKALELAKKISANIDGLQ